MRKKINNDYLPNGVLTIPAHPRAHDSVKIVYNGLLLQNGATQVYAHAGFGADWQNAGDYRMTRSDGGFEAAIPVIQADTLQLAFRDGASNWDNNSGKNYTYFIR
ncbi:Hypothetical protein LUCI_3629 [Lucifera butyrica]|uniref:Carbohydrate binding module family 25 domain-containing protein n=1 Tax=Lucifera butyrica TaxID=1351585 RepID=A0A498RBR9_9FIRM|nr:carbohydrate-binding protein [Lucifera butyrica]VBB08357.1 Hypothetical protein LUCI_3629 [Lucifera butyrica]